MKVSERISVWIKDIVQSADKKGVTLGISGGIDSAVVAKLSCMAIGAKNVLGLIMPCNSDPSDEKSALLLAGQIGIRTKRIELDHVYEAMKANNKEANQTALANLKPRLRMCMLYYYANTLDYLVAGTGNRSEIMVGYFTKYGDGAVDMLPIGGLLKTQVRELAEEIGIPKGIIGRTPSAGLWEGQTDENELGLSYEELDKILLAREKGPIKNASKEKVKRVNELIAKSAHKRCEAPTFVI